MTVARRPYRNTIISTNADTGTTTSVPVATKNGSPNSKSNTKFPTQSTGGTKPRLVQSIMSYAICVFVTITCTISIQRFVDFAAIATKNIKKYHRIDRAFSKKTKKLDKQLNVLYDLELFIPINHSSTTFHFDDLRFVPLQQQQLQQNQSSSLSSSLRRSTRNLIWMVPDVNNETNYIPTSLVESFINNSSNIDTTDTSSISTTITATTKKKICQIFCRFRTRSFGYTHFPHFLQQALPCWNVFHYFDNLHHDPSSSSSSSSSVEKYSYYMILPEKIEPTTFSPYVQEFIKVMERSPYHIQMIYGFNENLPVYNNCGQTIPSSKPKQKQIDASTSMSIMAIKYFYDTGWDHPCKYFLSTNNDDHSYLDAIQQLQREVLQNQYIVTTDPFNFRFEIVNKIKYQIIQVLILDRKGGTREFKYSNDIVTTLQNFVYTNYNTDTMYRLNVTYIPSFTDYTLYDQALSIHTADIIYSPHGAQLSNLLYIRPCTVVVEFFPKDYYIQFFQAFVVNAYGLSYEGYPMTNGSKVTDTQQMLLLGSQERKAVRSYPIPVPSQFFNQTIQQLMNATLHCRINFKR